jgi:two-component system response regulator AtoC
MDEPLTLELKADQGPELIVKSESLRRIHQMAARVALSPVKVLILGEAGVGKKTLARSIHAHSERAKRPFVSIKCATSDPSLEKALFGREAPPPKGVRGAFEIAHGGTIFLEEVGKLELSMQAKLLRVIETRECHSIGALKGRPVDVRFIAAAEGDLEVMAAQGKFRSDLLWSLNGITLMIPPLRERPEDIEPLARHFLAQMAPRRSGRLSSEAADLLRSWAWPGNGYQLRLVLERAYALSESGEITAEHLPVEAFSRERPPVPSDAAESPERQRIIEALARIGGNATRAAALSGMPRRTLLAKLNQYGIPRPIRKT